jgi:hypothetical protein
MKHAVITGAGTPAQRVVQPVSVRSAGGAELWQSTITSQNAPFGLVLAPDGQHLMICCNDLNLADSHEMLVGRSGSQVNVVKGFVSRGWLDATTMIGEVNSTLAYVAINSPSNAVSIGVKGEFIGAVQS